MEQPRTTTQHEAPARDTEGDRKRLDAKQAAEDFRAVLASPPARRFLGRLMLSMGVLKISFLPGEDAFAAAMREGARNTALNLLQQIDQERPGDALKILQEARTTHNERQAPT